MLLYVAPRDAGPVAPVDIAYLEFAGDGNREATRTDDQGVVGIRRGNAPAAWSAWVGDQPFGTWELRLTDTPALRTRLARGEIADLLLVVTYEGMLPEWPR